jgi:hypothetical protein
MWERKAGESNVVGLAPYIHDARQIDAVVAELSDVDRRAGLERVLAIGCLLLHRFFDGCSAVWRERRKNKNNSIRRIAAHPGCPLSRSALNETIAVYVAVQALPCVQTFGHITASHVAAVTFLAVDDQRRWIERAETSRWSVRELKDALRSERYESGERRGRPRVARQRRLVAGVRSAIGALRRAAGALGEVELGQDEARELVVLGDQIAALASELRGGRLARSEPCASRTPVADADRGSEGDAA